MTAVLVVDMLNEFVTGKLRCGGAQSVIPNIKALLPAARARGYPVVFTNDAHRPEGDREFEIWGPRAIAGTDAAQIIPELAAKPGDYIVPQRRRGETDLQRGRSTSRCVNWTPISVRLPRSSLSSFPRTRGLPWKAYSRRMWRRVLEE
jgi:hypothetical protein